MSFVGELYFTLVVYFLLFVCAAHMFDFMSRRQVRLMLGCIALAAGACGFHWIAVTPVMDPSSALHWSYVVVLHWPLPMAFVALFLVNAEPTPRTKKARCQCGYDLTGNVSGICPECGSSVHHAPLFDARDMGRIDLASPLSLRHAFMFPLQSSIARWELIKGALILCIPIIGWILNMGHRIAMTHRMQHGLPAWPAWRDYPALFRHGLITLLGMIEYHLPAIVCEVLAWRVQSTLLHLLGAVLWLVATIAVPGYMSHYCRTLDAREVFNPLRALRRVQQGGWAYWHAWAIALAALSCSFVGLLVFGIGFLFTSVWFWQVAGFSFGTVFSQRFGLAQSVSENRETVRPALTAQTASDPHPS